MTRLALRDRIGSAGPGDRHAATRIRASTIQ